MHDIVNKILFCLKVIFLLCTFVLTLYILLYMNKYYEYGIGDLIRVCIPIVLSLVMFVISFFFHTADKNTFYNVASVVALIAIIVIDYRTIFDQNMILWSKWHMNYYYFGNQILQIKILGYSLFLGNLVLFINERIIKKT